MNIRLFGLIGNPLTHSFSAKYFEEKFHKENIRNAVYQLFPLNDITALTLLIENYPELEGLNVTIPFKKSVMSYLSEKDDNAVKTSAVNVIRIIRTKGISWLKGYNTDCYGFEYSAPEIFASSGALILGTGGGASSVAYVLDKKGIQNKMVSRTRRDEKTIGYEDIDQKLVNRFPLIINATALGMFPEVDKSPPIPFHLLSSKNILYDLIYNPPETEFLRQGRIAGAKTFNGQKMLELQAEKSWELWNS